MSVLITMEAVVVDARGCTLKHDFYVKELAFYQVSTGEHWVDTFQPPFDRCYLRKKFIKQMDQQLQQNTAMKWEDGTYPYQAVYAVINCFAKTGPLYALGKDMCHWIQQYTCTHVNNVEELGCFAPPASQIQACHYHQDNINVMCALDRATQYGMYLHTMFSFSM